jgi:hypothetical protein
VHDAAQQDKFGPETMYEAGAIGFLGFAIEGYDCAGLN